MCCTCTCAGPCCVCFQSVRVCMNLYESQPRCSLRYTVCAITNGTWESVFVCFTVGILTLQNPMKAWRRTTAGTRTGTSTAPGVTPIQTPGWCGTTANWSAVSVKSPWYFVNSAESGPWLVQDVPKTAFKRLLECITDASCVYRAVTRYFVSIPPSKNKTIECIYAEFEMRPS